MTLVDLSTARERLTPSLSVRFTSGFPLCLHLSVFFDVFLSCLFDLHPDQNGTVFVFRGGMYWTVSPAGSVDGPLPLLQRWSRLPAAIEAAAFSALDFKWYFFKGAGLTSD